MRAWRQPLDVVVVFDCSLAPSTMSERPNAQRGHGGDVAAGPPRLLAERARWPSICPRRLGKHRQTCPQSHGGRQLEDIGAVGSKEPSKVLPPPTSERKSVATTGHPPVASHASGDKGQPSRRSLSTQEGGGGDTTFLAKLALHNELTSSSRQLHF